MNSQLLYVKNMLECCKHSSDQHSNFQIKETGLDAKLKSLTFEVDKNVDWLMFTPETGRDSRSRMSNLLAVTPGQHHHRACDSVVILTLNSIWYVLYLELKSNHLAPSNIAKQFKSTRQFVKYMFGLCNDLANIDIPEVKERFVVFCTKNSINKKPTSLRAKAATDPNEPNIRPVVNGESILLKAFVSP